MRCLHEPSIITAQVSSVESALTHPARTLPRAALPKRLLRDNIDARLNAVNGTRVFSPGTDGVEGGTGHRLAKGGDSCGPASGVWAVATIDTHHVPFKRKAAAANVCRPHLYKERKGGPDLLP
jgi:hypothetical protein